MKRILIAGVLVSAAVGQALAADLPPPPPGPPPRAPATYVPAPVPYYNWGGVYVGINAGYQFGTVSPGALAFGGPGPASNFSANGFLGGATLGFNWQWAALVIGLEGDLDYSSVNSSLPAADVPAGVAAGSFKSDWLATGRARVGYAIDRILLFATGGAAFAPAAIPGASATMTGWTGGAGVELALSPNWTAKGEYLYVLFPSPTLGGTSFKDTESVVRAGVNYKFSF